MMASITLCMQGSVNGMQVCRCGMGMWQCAGSHLVLAFLDMQLNWLHAGGLLATPLLVLPDNQLAVQCRVGEGVAGNGTLAEQ